MVFLFVFAEVGIFFFAAVTLSWRSKFKLERTKYPSFVSTTEQSMFGEISFRRVLSSLLVAHVVLCSPLPLPHGMDHPPPLHVCADMARCQLLWHLNSFVTCESSPLRSAGRTTPGRSSLVVENQIEI